MRQHKRKHRTAYHEAGHSVMSVLVGWGFPKLVINGDTLQGLGHTYLNGYFDGKQLETNFDETTESREPGQQAIMIYLAGIIAQNCFQGPTMRAKLQGGENDLLVAWKVNNWLCPDPARQKSHFLKLQQLAISTLLVPAAWAQVEALAQALIKQETIAGSSDLIPGFEPGEVPEHLRTVFLDTLYHETEETFTKEKEIQIEEWLKSRRVQLLKYSAFCLTEARKEWWLQNQKEWKDFLKERRLKIEREASLRK